MELTTKELSQLVNGVLKGDESRLIRGVANLEEATEDDVSFLKEKSSPAFHSFLTTKAGAVFVPAGTDAPTKNLIEVENPLGAFTLILSRIAEEKWKRTSGVHPTAYVSEKARVSSNASIGPFCAVEEGAEIGDGSRLVAFVYIGHKTKVGKNTILYPHVTLREEVIVGDRCILHAGCVIGSDGYGFYFDHGQHNKIPQVGTVVLEDDVEIGSCTTIDRATTGRTLIKKGTKVDNLVQIGHNVEIGENSLLVAQVGIAGSSKIGKGVVLAGQVGVSDHVTIADGTQVGGQSGIRYDTKPGEVLFGTPALPLQDTLKQQVLLRRLPEILRDLKYLKNIVKKEKK